MSKIKWHENLVWTAGIATGVLSDSWLIVPIGLILWCLVDLAISRVDK